MDIIILYIEQFLYYFILHVLFGKVENSPFTHSGQ